MFSSLRCNTPNSSSNRIALVGYTIIPALLIGVIDVREVKRNTFNAALTTRYGLTNRLELEARLPYVYRNDTSVGREVLQGAAVDTVFNSSGKGIGDVELTARYQFNDGGTDNPYYIGSLRFKSRTGTDPFEVMTTRISISAWVWPSTKSLRSASVTTTPRSARPSRTASTPRTR